MKRMQEALKYKDYPEGSLSKKYYDSFFIPFQDYLFKYYQVIDLPRWNYVNQKFVSPLFDGTNWEEYQDFIMRVKPSFIIDKSKVDLFFEALKNDDRFSLELKQFFSFLYSIDFFRDFSFEEWLRIPNWAHPWYEKEDEMERSIIELLTYENHENYIKEKFGMLSIFLVN